MTGLGAVSTAPRRRTDPDSARDVARAILAEGMTSGRVRALAATHPEHRALWLEIAEAMDELAGRRPRLRLLPGGAS